MTISRQLLPAIVLALAACKMSTGDLAPKTDAECAASGQKACGYKCVALDDPNTGCAEVGRCSPCTVPPNSEGVCTPALYCDSVCKAGWLDCNVNRADGCETFVNGSDPLNCGTCGRSCSPNACVQGMCGPETFVADGEPRGILHDPSNGRTYWVDSGMNGEVMYWDAFNVVYPLAIGLDPRPGAPAAFRIAIDQGATAVPKLYATGALQSMVSSGYDLTAFTIDPNGMVEPAPVFTEAERFAGEGFRGFAAARGGVFFTRDGTRVPCFAATGAAGMACVATPATDVRGLAAVGNTVLFGYAEGNGSLSEIDQALQEIPHYSNVGSWPSRIAVASAGVMLWADESNGNVWFAGESAAPILIDIGSVAWTSMDIAADGSGAIWMDNAAGTVRAARYGGNIFDIALGAEPLGVALSPTHFYWTDARNRTVNRVPR